MVIGIVGIGGLGTMGIKIAKALGHDVVAISTSAAKKEMAASKGATHFCVSTDAESLKAHAGMCNLILNTISADHDLNTYMPLLAKGGVMCELGLSMKPHTFSQLPLIFNRTAITGSNIGGIPATQEVLDLCAKHQIFPDCQTIKASQIDWAWDQLLGEGGNKDGIRYVIDVKASLQDDFMPKM